MSIRHLKRASEKYAFKVCKGMLIPQGDIKHLGSNVFAIRSPLTHEWTSFEVKEQFLTHECLSQELSDLIDYYWMIRNVVENSRAIQPFKHEIRSLDKEESQIFCLPQPPILGIHSARNPTQWF